MTSRRRIALAASLFIASAQGAPIDHPLTADIYRELVRFQSSERGKPFDEATWGTAGLLTRLLVDPGSPYSDVVDTPSFTNETWWPAFTQRVGSHLPNAFAGTLATLRWQTGLTKARPDIDLAVTAADTVAFGGREAAANAKKADLSPAIFRQARLRHPSRPTAAAREAVAMQLLREQMKQVPREQWEAMAIRKDVARRYMSDDIDYPAATSDRAYLMSILHMAIRTGSMSISPEGTQRLPAALRVARAAAAYKDALGYFGGPYCTDSKPSTGRPIDSSAFDHNSPLCFVAATDRAVHHWYRHEARLEASGRPLHENNHDGWNTLSRWINGFMGLIEIATLTEFSEALAAEALDAEEAAASTEAPAPRRLAPLICGVRRP
ncbi:hypothetical protein P3W24_00085 [Luteibacter sp. PPL201]|uniref:Uncharacterized protein n=1 Tax=Luteibacter sahnii TaxID=3021977 RepID=A0ABT6B5G3_9GAMM